MKCCGQVKGADCHCALCHQTFSSLRLFDKHQNVDYNRAQPVVCVAPATLGLAQDYRKTWATPEAVSSRLRKAEAMVSRRRERWAAVGQQAGGENIDR